MWVHRIGVRAFGAVVASCFFVTTVCGHGSVVSPQSRVHRVYASNPENPSFQLARNAIEMDGTNSYYTWTELSRNIPAAVQAGLPAGFDYSPWVPDGQLASGGRVDPNASVYPRTYRGLDRVSADWPTSPAQAGESLAIHFDAHTPHEPSVWDVWVTTPDWTPTEPLTWDKMEFLGRPNVTLSGMHYYFDVEIPANRVGHHVLWIAWQRDDPVGEVFFSTSDILVAAPGGLAGDYNSDNVVDAADYTVWRDHMGAAAGTLPNDVDGGVIGAMQYARWKGNFGAVRSDSTGSGSAGVSPSLVPEAGALLLALFAAAIGRRGGCGGLRCRMPRLILASGSPRRRELLEAAGYEFDVVVPHEDVECGVCSQNGPAGLVTDLAYRKANAVREVLRRQGDKETGRQGDENRVLVAADTVAELDGFVLGKPRDEEHARAMLRQLRGRAHRVLTGVCVWPLDRSEPTIRVAMTQLVMDQLPDDAIEEYLATGEWRGKAGAFGYQDRLGWVHVAEGSESNVVGLPMEMLAEMLAKAGAKTS